MAAVTMSKNAHRSVSRSMCVRCEGRRLVWNQMLGKSIPCPACSRRAKQDAGPLKALTKNAAQKRQENRLVARAVAVAILEVQQPQLAKLSPAHATTDRIMQRWATGMGSGLPYTTDELEQLAEEAAEQIDTFTAKQSNPPALDDATQVVIDLIVQHAPDSIGVFIRQWYCSPIPCRTMAQQRGIAHSEIYRELHAVLGCLRRLFLESRHADLIALVNGQL